MKGYELDLNYEPSVEGLDRSFEEIKYGFNKMNIDWKDVKIYYVKDRNSFRFIYPENQEELDRFNRNRKSGIN